MNDPSKPAIHSDWNCVQDHSRVYADFTYVYPVVSRRSQGLSIGVNLNPDKRCNFDCVYCEVDRLTPPRTRELNLLQVRAELASLVRSALEGQLARDPKFTEAPDLTRRIRDIAFSGDGEPTMVPNFDECVQVAVDVLRAFNLQETRLVLITDAAGLDKARVRAGLRLMDAHRGQVWAKLDAGTETYYRAVNRSHVSHARILKNLALCASERPIIIQSLFLRMHGERMTDSELEAYCMRLLDIMDGGGHIEAVHAYTIARPTPEPWATRLTQPELESIADVIRSRTGLAVEVYS
jgi:wyosine [tRNA(Phe)-imidazoG37] synthetase (radical SAM superfamily)